jgi:membrane-associated phospholipid phosphatase
MMWAVSALGDTVLLAPAAAFLTLYLAVRGTIRIALALGLALAVTGIATLASKLLFRACGSGLDLDVVSPSGHASFATLFYGALALLLGAKAPPAARPALAVATVALLGAIGFSRVAVDVHSPEEVVLGYVFGALGLSLFAMLKGAKPAPALWPLVLAGGCAAAFVVLSGVHFNFEGRIARVAARLAALDLCPPGPGGSAARTVPFGAGLPPGGPAARVALVPPGR